MKLAQQVLTLSAVLLISIGTLQTAFAQDKHIDPSEVITKHSLDYEFHPDVISAVTAANRTKFQTAMQAGLKSSTDDLLRCDAVVETTDDQDVATGVRVERGSELVGMIPSTVPAIITTQAEMDDLLNNATANINIVSQIMTCNGVTMGLNACSKPNSSPASIVIPLATLNLSDSDIGKVLVHELGHTLGLLDREMPGNPIMSNALGLNNEVNAAEAVAFHMNGTDDGPFRNLDLALVIDDTGSMFEDIGAVKRGLEKRLDRLAKKGLKECSALQLTTFKDNVTEKDPTIDLTVLKDEVSGLFAEGGGDCPENSKGALDAMSDKVKDGGKILFATDASPTGIEDAEQFFDDVTRDFKKKGIKVSTFLTGSCSGVFKSNPNRGPVASKSVSFKEATPRRSSSHVFIPNSSGVDILELGDDDKQEVLLPFTFNFARRDFSTVFVGSNGFISFANSDISGEYDADEFAEGTRRIAGLWADLDPSEGGEIRTEMVDGNFHIVFSNVPEFGATGLVNITFVLRPDNTFAVQYGEVTVTSGLAGATTGARSAFSETDLSSLASSPISVDAFSGVLYEVFESDFDLSNMTLEYSAVTLTHPTPPVSEIEVYSTLSQETGGIFVFLPEVKSGGTSILQRYENIVSNVAQGSFDHAIALSEPAFGPAGATQAVTLTGIGTDFQDGTTLTVSGSGVTVADVTVLSPTKLLATLQIDPAAEVGFRDLLATTDLGGGTIQEAEGTGSFEITTASTTPGILSVSPNSGMQSEQLDVTISGINTSFSNASVINLGDGITIQSVQALSATQLQATIVINADADVGFRDVSIVTGVEVVNNISSRPFFVSQAEEVLEVSLVSVSPEALSPGSTHTISIEGENTNFMDGMTEVSITGEGITVVSTLVTSPTSLSADLLVTGNAPPGFRDVRVVTGAEVVLLTNALSISAFTPAIPVLTEPGNEATEIDPAAVTFSWESADRAETYRIQVARDVSFTDIFKDIEGLTETTVTETLTGTTNFFWRVQASNEVGASGWSEISAFTTAIGVGIETYESGLPTRFALNQNYPNPFNPSTEIRFALPEAAHVQLAIYDITGREITRLIDQPMSAGFHAVTWDAVSVPSGTYLYRISAGDFVETRTMTFLK